MIFREEEEEEEREREGNIDHYGTIDQQDVPDAALVLVGRERDEFSLRMARNQEQENPAQYDQPLKPDEPVVVSHAATMTIDEIPLVPEVKDSTEIERQFYSRYKALFVKGEAAESPQKGLVGKFHILLLADSFELCHEGVAALNRCLAFDLVEANSGTVTSTVFESLEEINSENLEFAKKLNIKLLSLANICREYKREDDLPTDIYRDITSNPEKYTEVFYSPEPSPAFPTYTHIVGHVPVTHEYALFLKKSLFRLSKLIVFFHIIPQDLDPFRERLNVEIPTLERLIEIARLADVVYSVSRKVFDYFAILFRAKNVLDVDHRLYIPSAPREIFDMPFNNRFYDRVDILTNGFLCNSSTCFFCNGLDVTTHVMTKLKKEKIEVNGMKLELSLTISHVAEKNFDRLVTSLGKFGDSSVIKNKGDDSTNVRALYKEANFFVAPKRCEAYGFYGLFPFCAGMPALVPEDSIAASVISEISEEAGTFILPVNKNQDMFKQCGSTWYTKILNFIKNFDSVKILAEKIKIQLLSDETTRNTHDNFLSFVLGGISMKMRVTSLVPLDAKEKDKTGLKLRFEELLVKIMRVCWRLKSHSLESCSNHEYAGSQLVHGAVLPIDRIINNVLSKVEEQGRRVVAIDDESKSLVIFCPTRKALRDLWAKCNIISCNLLAILTKKEQCNSLLNNLKIKSVETELIIEGSEFYKMSQFLENVYEKM